MSTNTFSSGSTESELEVHQLLLDVNFRWLDKRHHDLASAFQHARRFLKNGRDALRLALGLLKPRGCEISIHVEVLASLWADDVVRMWSVLEFAQSEIHSVRFELTRNFSGHVAWGKQAGLNYHQLAFCWGNFLLGNVFELLSNSDDVSRQVRPFQLAKSDFPDLCGSVATLAKRLLGAGYGELSYAAATAELEMEFAHALRARGVPLGKAPERVVIGERGELMVFGKTKHVTESQRAVVVALLSSHQPTLTKDELAVKSRHSDAVGILKRLARSDPAWAEVIQLAGKTGGGYRIE